MTAIGNNMSAMSQLPSSVVGSNISSEVKSPRLAAESGNAEELRKQFTQFVGEAFYGQMLKAMRATIGKPAYFHGGRAEEVFQGQLDQQMTEHLTEASADKFAEPMFERQFPQFAKSPKGPSLNELAGLRRA
jgi:Rod binding domain-containing protein